MQSNSQQPDAGAVNPTATTRCAAPSASARPKTFQESARCPVCLTVGEMRFQYGHYCCDRCDQCWRTDTLGHWMKAFEQGREFERQNPELNRESEIEIMKTEANHETAGPRWLRRLVRFITWLLFLFFAIVVLLMSTGCSSMKAVLGNQNPPLKHSVRVLNYPMPPGSERFNTYRLQPKH